MISLTMTLWFSAAVIAVVAINLAVVMEMAAAMVIVMIGQVSQKALWFSVGVTVVDATNLAVVMEMAAVAEIKTTIPITDCLFN
jgi:hypothetical protein